jgi:hypothetical protein
MSAGPPLRTGRPAPALLPGTATRRAPVVVARPPVSRNTPPHALTPSTRAEGIHHHAGLAYGAARSASADSSIAAGQMRAAWWRDGILEGCGEMPIGLNPLVRGRGSVRGGGHIWGVGV